MTFEVILELFLADATILMCNIPYHRWGITDDALNGEIAHNLSNWLGGIDRPYPYRSV